MNRLTKKNAIGYFPAYERETKSVNRDEERVCFLRKIIEKDLETSEILKTIFKSIIKNYDDIDQNFTIYLNTELYDKLKELLNDK